MRAKTKLLLYKLLWVNEVFGRPSVVRLLEGFRGWESRAGLERTLRRLEKEAIVEAEGRSLDRVFRLTARGRGLLSPIEDPELLWAREWDGMWRMVVFDIPESERPLRMKLRETLLGLRFGCMQKSVWVSPDPIPEMVRLLRRGLPAPAALSLFEGSELASGGAKAMVRSAWQFDRINRAYFDYLGLLKLWEAEPGRLSLDEWLEQEFEAWNEAVSLDPFLPNSLLPGSYMGKKAFRRRKALPRLIESTAHQMDITANDR